MNGRAYNVPAQDCTFTDYVYVVRMCKGEVVETSHPLKASEVDNYIGWRHRAGWQYLDYAMRPL